MTGRKYTVGRDDSCDLIITEASAHVTRLHFELTVVNGKASIINRSDNGTFLNNGKLTKDIPYIISSNDTIALLHDSNPMFCFILLSHCTITFWVHSPLDLVKSNSLYLGTYSSQDHDNFCVRHKNWYAF